MVKIIEIPFPGQNSIAGSIYKEFNKTKNSNIEEFKNVNYWIFLTKANCIAELNQQCIEMELPYYLVADVDAIMGTEITNPNPKLKL
jgi:reverse gyrase